MNVDACRISIITVTHNSGSVLQKCLSSIEAAAAGLPFEIIIVDNNSADDSLAIVQTSFPDAQIVRNDKNRGFAAACNQGTEIAKGDYLLFLNPDLIADKGSIAALVEAYESLDRPGFLSGRMRNPDGSFQATCRRFPTINNLIFSRQSPLSLVTRRDHRAYTYPDSETLLEVEAVAGTMMLASRVLFDRLGRFDERFFVYLEDSDISLRAHYNKYHNYFVPAAGAEHLWGGGSDASPFRRRYYHHLSMFRFFLKHYPNGFSLILLPLLLIMNLTLLTLVSLFRPSSPEDR